MSPRALFVTTVPITLEAFLVPFATHFRLQGWQVDALANGATGAERIAHDFDARHDISWSRNPLAPGNLIGAARRVREVVAAGGYDVVHVHTPIAAWVTRYALRGLRRSPGHPVVIYTAHGFHFYRGQKPLPHAVFRTMERVAAPWTDLLVTINREDFEAARALGSIDPSRVRYIPGIGVDTMLYSPAAVPAADASAFRRSIGVAAEEFLLTMVAEFSAVKRHSLALDALAQVAEKRVVLALAGDGPLETQVREQVARQGLNDRVRFAGYRRDLPTVYTASDALLLCSEREGLNRSALEAMASGVPVIGTSTRGIADAIGSDVCGWICEPTAQSLAQAITDAATNPVVTAEKGARARARALSNFALPRIIDAYEELYREALASRV